MFNYISYFLVFLMIRLNEGAKSEDEFNWYCKTLCDGVHGMNNFNFENSTCVCNTLEVIDDFDKDLIQETVAEIGMKFILTDGRKPKRNVETKPKTEIKNVSGVNHVLNHEINKPVQVDQVDSKLHQINEKYKTGFNHRMDQEVIQISQGAQDAQLNQDNQEIEAEEKIKNNNEKFELKSRMEAETNDAVFPEDLTHSENFNHTNFSNSAENSVPVNYVSRIAQTDDSDRLVHGQYKPQKIGETKGTISEQSNSDGSNPEGHKLNKENDEAIVPDVSVPQENVLEGSVLEGSVPEESVHKESVSKGHASDKSAPEGSNFEESKSEEKKPKERNPVVKFEDRIPEKHNLKEIKIAGSNSSGSNLGAASEMSSSKLGNQENDNLEKIELNARISDESPNKKGLTDIKTSLNKPIFGLRNVGSTHSRSDSETQVNSATGSQGRFNFPTLNFEGIKTTNLVSSANPTSSIPAHPQPNLLQKLAERRMNLRSRFLKTNESEHEDPLLGQINPNIFDHEQHHNLLQPQTHFLGQMNPIIRMNDYNAAFTPAVTRALLQNIRSRLNTLIDKTGRGAYDTRGTIAETEAIRNSLKQITQVNVNVRPEASTRPFWNALFNNVIPAFVGQAAPNTTHLDNHETSDDKNIE